MTITVQVPDPLLEGLAESPEDVTPRDDADDPLVAEDGDSAVARREQPLELSDRRLLVAGGGSRAHDSFDRRGRFFTLFNRPAIDPPLGFFECLGFFFSHGICDNFCCY